MAHPAYEAMSNRGDRIRTCDFVLPKHALCQTELRPAMSGGFYPIVTDSVRASIPAEDALFPGVDVGDDRREEVRNAKTRGLK